MISQAASSLVIWKELTLRTGLLVALKYQTASISTDALTSKEPS